MEDKKETRSSHESYGVPLGIPLNLEETLLGEAYAKMEKEEYEPASRIFDDILKRFSVVLNDAKKSLLHSELGMLLFWLGDYEGAKKHCERAIAHGGDKNDQALVVLGKVAVAEYKFPEARGYFSKISESNPAKELGLSLVCIKLRDTKGAETFLQQAMKFVSPKDPEYLVLFNYFRLLHGDTQGAVSEARTLLAKCAKDPSLVLLIAETFMTAGNYGEATAAAKKVSLPCPENDHAYAILAYAAYAEEELAAAESNARESIRLNPRNAYARTVLMKLATREGNYSLAESIALDILGNSPEYSLTHANLGDVYFNSGSYNLAEIEYEQTQQLMDSNTKGAKLRQARMKFIAEKYDEASEILEQLIKTQHTYYDDAMCDLVLCYDKLGDEYGKSEVLDKMELRRSFYHRTEKILKQFAS